MNDRSVADEPRAVPDGAPSLREIANLPRGPLTDCFGRVHTYLRLSVTDRCNLRCTYCMPPGGIASKDRAEILTFEELGRIVGLFARLGIRKVRITGGEPLVRRGIADLVGMLARIDGVERLCLTTNGVLLAEQAGSLKRAGLSGANISLDSLRPDRFAEITGEKAFARVIAGIDAALDAGLAPLKVNVVVMRGVNDDELLDFVEFVRYRPVALRFIEFMPSQSNGWDISRLVSAADMERTIGTRYRLASIEPDAGAHATARDYAIEGFRGTVGIVSSMSRPFCERCNRLRLTADGSLKTCLFHPPVLDLRSLLRAGTNDANIAEGIGRAVRGKPEGRPDPERISDLAGQDMVRIGG